MRFLVAHPGPQFSVQDVYAGWVEALRDLGQQVVEFNLGERLTFYGSVQLERDGTLGRALSDAQAHELAVNGLYAALYKTRPDVLLVVSAFFIPPDLLDLARRSGTRVVLLFTESPYQDGQQLAYAQHADLCLLNDPTNLDRFRQATTAAYVPHAYRPRLHHPGPADPTLACDLAFVGTGYASRIAFLEAMVATPDLDGFDVLLAGNWQLLAEDSPLRTLVAHELDECLGNAQTAQVYRSAKVGLNLYRREAERPEQSAGWAMGPREVEQAACQLFFLRDARPEGDQVLAMLPTFASPEDAAEQLRFWLDRDGARAAVASKARAAIADRTFTSNAAALLRLLDRQPANA